VGGALALGVFFGSLCVFAMDGVLPPDDPDSFAGVTLPSDGGATP
jgi:hypothetical protein